MQERVLCALDSQGDRVLAGRLRGSGAGGSWDFPMSDEVSGLKRLHEWGEARARLIVTRHRIDRRAQVVSAQGKVPQGDFEWFDLRDLPKAAGSSFKKTWQSIRETFPEALPRK